MAQTTLEPNATHIPFETLVARLGEIFEDAGASPEVASILATNCASCERDGTLSHGVFRMTGYLHSLGTGWADGKAQPKVDRVSESYIRIDGANGFAQPALHAAEETIEDALVKTGIAVVAVHDSHHFSALWPELEVFARRGNVALGMVASGKLAVAPAGTHQPVFSTNPFGFATPVDGAEPVVFDYATSSISHGDLQLHRRDGKQVPPGTGIDGDGKETNDPDKILSEGAILPFGGHKGALLSLMIEVLAAGLTGGAFTYEMDDESPEGAHTFRTGQLYIIVDPERGGNDVFGERIAQFIEMLREAGMTRMPGDRRYATRATADEQGIPVTDQIRGLFA